MLRLMLALSLVSISVERALCLRTERAELPALDAAPRVGLNARPRRMREQPAARRFGRATLAWLRARRRLPALQAAGRELAAWVPVPASFAR